MVAFASLTLATLMAIPWPSADESRKTAVAQSRQTMAGYVAALLARDSHAFDRLLPAFIEAPAALRRALIDAAARSNSPRALPFLEHALVHAPELRLATLAGVGRIGARCCAPIGEDTTACIASLLIDVTGNRRILRAACLAAGHVHAHATVPALVDLLAHGDEHVRQAAHRALCRITGLDTPGDAERWFVWLRDETTWQREQRPRVAADLASDDVRLVTAALDEAAMHRYRRDAIALDVAQALEHPSRSVRLRACAVLGELGGRGVPAHLVHLLGSTDVELAAAAYAVITDVVGREVSAMPNACRSEIGLEPR